MLVCWLAARTQDAQREQGAEPVDFSITRSFGNPMREVADIGRLGRTLKRLCSIYVWFSFIVKVMIYATFAARLAGVPIRMIRKRRSACVGPSRKTWYALAEPVSTSINDAPSCW